ncbi:MAG TPA: hypothetical protein VLV86_11110 [Vicinamibacterales bacterium]|nr:hypothetical protein [Vicinamibacterales bacterium]
MRRVSVVWVVLAATVLTCVALAADTLPDRFSDEEFWRMATEFSERAGTFQSDNLLSNERWFQHVLPSLVQRAKQNAVYVGVGPEQNFTYIVALKPKMAFIVDIRRGNFDFHLIYKALFEMSADRAEFVSRLFSRPRPDGLDARSTVEDMFAAFAAVQPTDALYSRNMRAIVNQLTKVHQFQLSSADILRMQHIYNAIYVYGPSIQYSTTTNAGRRITREPTYAELMKAADQGGFEHSFLATEEAFEWLKAFESENRLVPLMGDFAGPKALRSVGQYLTANHALVSAFYLSNVEEYLKQDGKQTTFCANAATLPVDDTSTFIRSTRSGTPDLGFELMSELAPMKAELAACHDVNEGGTEK